MYHNKEYHRYFDQTYLTTVIKKYFAIAFNSICYPPVKSSKHSIGLSLFFLGILCFQDMLVKKESGLGKEHEACWEFVSNTFVSILILSK